MCEKIGDTAGKVWSYLKDNGSASSTKLQRELKADAATTNQAIGWLAREGKLEINREQRVPTFSLREQ